MVGLGVVLEEVEPQKTNTTSINNNTHHHQVINKTTMMINSINHKTSSHHSPFQVSNFLNQCFLCNKKLLPGKDIYMYKGDRAFCSVDCRCKQILKDEEEAIEKKNCSLDGFA